MIYLFKLLISVVLTYPKWLCALDIFISSVVVIIILTVLAVRLEIEAERQE